jgi:hypothetical protein
MVALNEDRDNTAFIIGDTPMRLPATGTAIQAWADNTDGATSTGESGIVTASPYVGVYYPSGQTNDLSGNAVAVPPSYAVLRAIIKSDNISYPWLAPAGTRRGLIDNLNTIGYVDADSGQFISIGVTQGLRDVMYTNKINPLTNLPGTGLVIYGQKTCFSQNFFLIFNFGHLFLSIFHFSKNFCEFYFTFLKSKKNNKYYINFVIILIHIS